MKRIFKGRVKKGREGGIRAGERGGEVSQERGRETHVWDYREGEKGKRGKTTFGATFGRAGIT